MRENFIAAYVLSALLSLRIKHTNLLHFYLLNCYYIIIKRCSMNNSSKFFFIFLFCSSILLFSTNLEKLSLVNIASIPMTVEPNNKFNLGLHDICTYTPNGLIIQRKLADKVTCTNKLDGNTRTWKVKTVITKPANDRNLLGSILTPQGSLYIIAS